MRVEAVESIVAYGHENIRAAHRTTFEITKDCDLSRKGDCIVAVSADKGLADLSTEFKRSLQKENAKLVILIEAGDRSEKINASGSTTLLLTHPRDTVVRKSRYVCGRTLAVCADKASCDLSRGLLEKLRNPEQKIRITLTVGI